MSRAALWGVAAGLVLFLVIPTLLDIRTGITVGALILLGYAARLLCLPR